MVKAYPKGVQVERDKYPSRAAGFTLIELLATIGIIALLAMMLFPAAKNMLASGKKAACLNSLRQVYIGARNFGADNKNEIPWTSTDPADKNSTGWNFWIYRISEYAGLEAPQTLGCPDAPHNLFNGARKGVYQYRLNNPNYCMNTALTYVCDLAGTPQAPTPATVTRPYRFTDLKNAAQTVLYFDGGNYTMVQATAKSPASPWNYVPGYSKNKGKISYAALNGRVTVDAEAGRHGKTVNFVYAEGSMGTATADKFVEGAQYWSVPKE